MDWPDDILPATAAALLESGRRVCHVAPGHALVQFRAAAAAVAQHWLKATGEGSHGTLHGRLEALEERVPSARAAVAELNIVRRKGNHGAHPEQRPDPPSLADVEEAHQAFHRALCAWASDHAGVEPNQLPPAAPLPETDWPTVCKEALLDRDETALLVVAARMTDEARTHRDQLHRDSKDVLVDVSSTLPYLEDAVATYKVAWRHHGTPQAAREAAILLLDDLGHSFDEALPLLAQAAHARDAGALFHLAMLHLHADPRLGGEHDPVEGLALLNDAADREHPEALHELALRTLRGEPGEQGQARALSLLRRSADAGFPQGRVDLVERLLSRRPFHDVEAEIAPHRAALEEDEPHLAQWVDFVVQRARKKPCDEADFQPLQELLYRQYPPARLARARWYLTREPSVESLVAAGNDAATALRHGTTPETWCAARQVLYRVVQSLSRTPAPFFNAFAVRREFQAWLDLTDDELPNRPVAPVNLIRELQEARSKLSERALGDGVLPTDGPAHLDELLEQLQVITGDKQPAHKRSRIPGRNAACVCGSGRKFKACCEREPELPVWLVPRITRR